MDYEVMLEGRHLYFFSRKMDLDGRFNLVFEEDGPQKTRVTVTSRYVVKRDQTVRDVNGQFMSRSDTVSFNSNGSASYPATPSGEATVCRSRGVLEREILDAVR